ncbi:MAG: TonB-dependent receptor [Megasphaera cerevisiae]|nr:TonB-dependent receptor [Megasphaera cerevisiae]
MWRQKVQWGGGGNNPVTTRDVVVEADRAKEEAKLESQQTTIITREDIVKKQAKSVEDVIFSETGVSRTVDAMGRVGVSIRGAEPRHTLILVDGQPVMGDVSKYSGAGDELQRLGAENVDHIEIIRGAASAKYGSDAIGGVINVITKRPAKTAGLQVNAEGRRAKHDGDLFPYQNVFLRADSGQVGKFCFGVYGSKRDIMPIYSAESHGGLTGGTTMRNALRYYGDIKNIGVMGSYDIDDRNTIDVTMDRTNEDLQRVVKHTDYIGESPQTFKRTMDRNTYRLSYRGNNGGSTDWNVHVDYAKMNEDDMTMTSQYGLSKYEGKNTLNYVDDLEHKQLDIKASANTQVNDRHLLTYGFGYTKETAEGSRLKSAPTTWSQTVDPWNYDKNLYSGRPSSVHDYAITYKNGVPQYDETYERYGTKDDQGHTITPAFTREDFEKYFNASVANIAQITKDGRLQDFLAFRDILVKQNPDNMYVQIGQAGAPSYLDKVVFSYYTYAADADITKMMIEASPDQASKLFAKWNGKMYRDELVYRDNRRTLGKAEIKKQNVFIQDTWQLNDTTVLSHIFRVDHSDLFGTNATFNLGMTHNLGGKVNHRLKANIGTGYTEPGMGELYYNWEMYPGMPVGDGIGKMGYYWIGNPDLKPEKSVNFDLGMEGENGNLSTRVSVFHNRITDYMTTYFTGYLMDFNPYKVSDKDKWLTPPDMIYSFKNIGKAEITGAEAEVNYRFDNHWSGKLGYTYLHAINKSDPDMPRQLLDRPQHKVDIGVTYENKGWRASLWGNYYIHMLDSNTVVNDGNYWKADGHGGGGPSFAVGGSQTYARKTFGLWNILVQKELSKDSTIYAGVDNLFNHHDDDRAFQERVYKFGVNLKFGADGRDDGPASQTVEHAKESARAKLRDDDWFIKAPFDTKKEEGVEYIGDYRARWNSYTGETKPEGRVTKNGMIGDAEKNMLGKPAHGFEQRIRAGIDARLGDDTNVTILGSAAGMSGVDTKTDISESKGLNHQRLDTMDVTQHASKWDFSIGRLTEAMGVTGYWFGKEYDGGRAVWTSGRNQVRIGYGDFSSSTGISDSAYTHATRQWFWRAPTKREWLGYNGERGDNMISTDAPPFPEFSDFEANTGGEYEGMYQKLAKAQTFAEQKAIIKEYLDVIQQIDEKEGTHTYDNLMKQTFRPLITNSGVWQKVTVAGPDGTVKSYYGMGMTDSNLETTSYTIQDILDDDTILDKFAVRGEAQWQNIQNTYGDKAGSGINNNLYYQYTGDQVLYHYGSGQTRMLLPADQVDIDKDFKIISKDDAKQMALSSIWSSQTGGVLAQSDLTTEENGIVKTQTVYGDYLNRGPGSVGAQILTWMTQYVNGKTGWVTKEGESMPLLETLAGQPMILVKGTVLVRDQIPAIDKAAFAQIKHQFGDDFGVQAWYFRSVGDDTHSVQFANDRLANDNDVASFDQLANVIGLGATWRIGNTIHFSYDWGQNRTDFGCFMNGNTIYNHETGTSDFDILGRSNGGTPRFWVARVDIGKSDTNVPGSWNAFADYKYFQHGSFFGGKGTEGVPDRYLDGIKSFTIGGGYVPAKDILLEAFYTFDAKGIGKRDTLYGSENFSLGDYTRIQMTYRF